MLVELGLEVEELERVVQKESEDDRELEMEEEALRRELALEVAQKQALDQDLEDAKSEVVKSPERLRLELEIEKEE